MLDTKTKEAARKIMANLKKSVQAAKEGKTKKMDKLNKERVKIRKEVVEEPIVVNESQKEIIQKGEVRGLSPNEVNAYHYDELGRRVINQELAEYHKWADAIRLMKRIKQLELNEEYGVKEAPTATVEMLVRESTFGKWRKYIENGRRQFKAFLDKDLQKAKKLGKVAATYTTGTNAGAEWVPTGYSASLIDVQHLPFKFIGQIPREDMPTKKWNVPSFTADLHFQKHTEPTDDDPSRIAAVTAATDDVNLVAKDLAARVTVTIDEEEDAIFSAVKGFSDKLRKAEVMDLEDMVINGDTSGTHMDSDVTSAADRRKTWMGLRRYEIDDTQSCRTDLSTLSFAKIVGLRNLLKANYRSPESLVYVGSPKATSLIGALTQFATLNTYGSEAHVLTGRVYTIAGVPYYESEKVREDLNNSGQYDATTMSKTIVLCVNKEAFCLGQYKSLKVVVLRKDEYDVYFIIGKFRADFMPTVVTTTVAVIALGYNMA